MIVVSREWRGGWFADDEARGLRGAAAEQFCAPGHEGSEARGGTDAEEVEGPESGRTIVCTWMDWIHT